MGRGTGKGTVPTPDAPDFPRSEHKEGLAVTPPQTPSDEEMSTECWDVEVVRGECSVEGHLEDLESY